MDIKKILEEHKKWMINNSTGARADLRGANLCEANLCGADLHQADLCEAEIHFFMTRGEAERY
jgi:uncharacterized protein YjbI with pentapeptide repeats